MNALTIPDHVEVTLFIYIYEDVHGKTMTTVSTVDYRNYREDLLLIAKRNFTLDIEKNGALILAIEELRQLQTKTENNAQNKISQIEDQIHLISSSLAEIKSGSNDILF